MKKEFELVFREVAHGSEDYFRAVELRDEVLRRPLGLEFSAGDLAAEGDSFHLTGWLHGELVACAILEPVTAATIRLRQFAVREGFRSMGVGGWLLECAERFARERGCVFIHLHARETAVRFYQKAGYLPFGDRFVEVTIPHVAMSKSLTGH